MLKHLKVTMSDLISEIEYIIQTDVSLTFS